jgi:hypothetical protein
MAGAVTIGMMSTSHEAENDRLSHVEVVVGRNVRRASYAVPGATIGDGQRIATITQPAELEVQALERWENEGGR